MAKTYDPIATQTLGSAVASVTFSSIPATYTDLVLVVSAQNNGANFYLKPNSASGSVFSQTALWGEGTVAASGRYTAADIPNNGWLVTRLQVFPNTTSVFGICAVHVMNYANTTTFKTALSRYSNAGTVAGINANLWQSTAAITSLECIAFASTWAIGSVFTLYGIKSA